MPADLKGHCPLVSKCPQSVHSSQYPLAGDENASDMPLNEGDFKAIDEVLDDIVEEDAETRGVMIWPWIWIRSQILSFLAIQEIRILILGFDRNRIFNVRPKMNILHQKNRIFGRITE